MLREGELEAASAQQEQHKFSHKAKILLLSRPGQPAEPGTRLTPGHTYECLPAALLLLLLPAALDI